MRDEGVFGKKIQSLGIPVHCLRIHLQPMPFKSILYYCQLLKTYRPQIVQAWLYHANFFAILLKPFLPKHKVFFNIRTALNQPKYFKISTHLIIKFNAWLSRFSSGIINNSKVSENQHAKLGFYSKKFIYIGNGFNINHFKPSKEAYIAFRKRRNLSIETKIVECLHALTR